MPRKPSKPKQHVAPAASFDVGDLVFFSGWGTSGEAICIGQLRADPGMLVLAVPGMVREPFIEWPAERCAPTGRQDRHSGQTYRESYGRRNPKRLLGSV